MMIKVSVIVPAYNVESYLGKCLESLVQQTLPELEIIVINDGSTDGTERVANRFQEQYPEKIIVKTTENGGAAAARNMGLTLAHGEYIGFVDADDHVSLSMFETLYHAASESDSDIACCGYQRVDGDEIQNRAMEPILDTLYGTNIFEEPDLLIYSTPYLWNKIFRRSMLEERRIVFQGLRIYEDLVFTYQSFLHARKIQYVMQPLYHYIVSRDGSLTSVFSEKRFDLMKAFDYLKSYYQEQGCYERFAEGLFFILMKHVFVVCEERASLQNRSEKLRFIQESFAYMKEINPDMAAYQRYYQVYRHNKKKHYENMKYWRFLTYVPFLPEMRKKLGKLKRSIKNKR